MSDPGLDHIRDKVPLTWTGEASFSMLANGNRPTPEEKKAIELLAAKVVMVRNYNDEHFGPPRPFKQTYRRGFDVALAQLYTGEFTYGQFARETQRLATARDAEERRLAEQQADREAEAWRSIADSAKSASGSVNGAAFQPIQPRRAVNCYSNRIGNGVSTTCY